MGGVPVYLASLSRYSPITQNTVLVPDWTKLSVASGIKLLREAIGPMGDRNRERVFRMNLTLCLHRALRSDEIAKLPASFFEGEPEGIAGAPVEILWENIPGALSTKPCANPDKLPIPGHETNPWGWIPLECGVCESCLARAAA